MLFQDRLPKNKMYLVGMSILSILLRLRPGYHTIQSDQDITFKYNIEFIEAVEVKAYEIVDVVLLEDY